MAVEFLPDAALPLGYLLAAVLFIQGMRDMTHPRTAARRNLISAGGMFVAVGIPVVWVEILSPVVLFGGLILGAGVGTALALTVERTDLPHLFGVSNWFGGGASAVIAFPELISLG